MFESTIAANCMYVYLSVCLFVCLSKVLYSSNDLSVCLSVCSERMYVCMYVYVSVCLSICLSVCLSDAKFVCNKWSSYIFFAPSSYGGFYCNLIISCTTKIVCIGEGLQNYSCVCGRISQYCLSVCVVVCPLISV